MKTKLIQGDNILSLKTLPDNSVDSIVSDPPYGLSFMGKKWDYDVPSVEFWKEVYRVLKPGGHVLSFGGTRTYHRMTVNIEDAGFEIRDQIMWLYGSGFPKSHNIGKSVDKIQGNERKVDEEKTELYKGTSEWEGWGTALKPANEPICVARKPLSEKTVALNVLKWGTGGINIDGCRVGIDGGSKRDGQSDKVSSTNPHLSPTKSLNRTGHGIVETGEGRFPANIILDEEAGEVLDENSGVLGEGHWPKGSTKGFGEYGGGTNSYEGVGPKDKTKGGASRFFYQAKVSKKERNMGLDGFEDKASQLNSGGIGRKTSVEKRLDENGENAATTKNTHPTVKPVALMAYLVRLVTPPNGIVLDPFMGSGSTGIAARLEGFRFCGMEMDEDYFKIASSRIENFESYREFIKK